MMIWYDRGGHGCHPGRERGGRFGSDAGPRGFGRGGWPGRGGFGEARGGRARRMFDGGELQLLLLKLIADEPRHGYDLIRSIEELTGGAYAPSPGVVYPTITLLGDMGLIEEHRTEGAKKLFAATDAGRQHLAEHRERVDALIARLTAMGAEHARTDRHAVRRAMLNLREVLMNRLGAGDLADAKLDQAVALIDETAQKIERL